MHYQSRLYLKFSRYFCLSALCLIALSACSSVPSSTASYTNTEAASPNNGGFSLNDHIPDYAALNFVPFNRQDVAAIALREWRLFGSPVSDADPHSRPEPTQAALKPERLPGLWQRIGEYWWIGQDPGDPSSGWTGKTNQNGTPFSITHDGHFAWSAAFISYVMRVAGANNRFTYSPNHATYINAAASGSNPDLLARDPANYAPQIGDLLCVGRGKSRNITYNMLPTSYGFPAHCGIVVATQQNDAPFGTELSIIGGNVDDSVSLTHVPTDAAGHISDSQGNSYDTRYPWLTILAPHYDAEEEPLSIE